MYKDDDHSQNMSSLKSYKCLVLDTGEEKIKFCKTVKVNPEFISEVVQMGSVYLRCPENLYDELLTFLSGKKIVLFEGINIPRNKKHTRFELTYDEESLAGHFYVKIKTNVNNLIMSNGNNYYVLAE